MKINTQKLQELQNLTKLTATQAIAIKGGDDKRPPRPPGNGGPPNIPPGGGQPNAVSPPEWNQDEQQW